ncbi:MAG: isochorismatase [Gemmatimonadota bacterium]
MGSSLPVPAYFDPERVGQVWRVPYERRAAEAERWAAEHGLRPAAEDELRVCLVAVDVQNTFCIPEFELFVGGRSGTGAVDDNRRLCEFIYRNLAAITRICPTMDTHQAFQIFHSVFLIGADGRHPDPYTLISAEDVERGAWRVNPAVYAELGLDEASARQFLRHYTRCLKEGGKYDLTIWPYHAMLGGIGHALVSAVEEAVFFHTIARQSPAAFQVKGNLPLTEHYSVLGPEVREDPDGRPIAGSDDGFIEMLIGFDAILVAGQAKSHCVAWTIEDLLVNPLIRSQGLAGKVYLLEDCTSPVVVPGVIDFTEEAESAFRRFADAGMHVVRSTDPMESWPGIAAALRC